MIPRCGPMQYSPFGLSGVSIAAAASNGPVAFRWPRAVFCTGFLLFPESGSLVDAAHLKIRIQDESFTDMITDGAGAQFYAPALLLHGFGFRIFDLQRPVAAGDLWYITLANTYAAVTAIVPRLAFAFEEPTR